MPTNPEFTPVDGNSNILKAIPNGDGTANLVTSAASTVATDITYPSAAQAPSNSGVSFSTATTGSLAVDITLTSFTGGTSPTVTFFLDQLGSDGVWYRVWTSAALSTPGVAGANIGPGESGTPPTGFTNVTAVLTGTCRFGWSSTGTPTAITFSASVIGR